MLEKWSRETCFRCGRSAGDMRLAFGRISTLQSLSRIGKILNMKVTLNGCYGDPSID